MKNGEDVLELLKLIRHKCDFALEEFVADLHKNEEIVDPTQKELNFYETRMKGRISQDEINELKRNVEKIKRKIFEIKTSLIDCICGLVQSKYFKIPVEDKISLVKNTYLILASSIQTLDTKFVEVEQKTAPAEK